MPQQTFFAPKTLAAATKPAAGSPNGALIDQNYDPTGMPVMPSGGAVMPSNSLASAWAAENLREGNTPITGAYSGLQALGKAAQLVSGTYGMKQQDDANTAFRQKMQDATSVGDLANVMSQSNDPTVAAQGRLWREKMGQPTDVQRRTQELTAGGMDPQRASDIANGLITTPTIDGEQHEYNARTGESKIISSITDDPRVQAARADKSRDGYIDMTKYANTGDFHGRGSNEAMAAEIKDGEKRANDIATQANGAQANIQRLDQISRLYADPTLITGAMSGNAIALKQFGNALGIGDAPTKEQVIGALNNTFLSSLKSTFGARVTNFDVSTFAKGLPDLVKSPEATQQIIAFSKAAEEAKQQQMDYASQWRAERAQQGLLPVLGQGFMEYSNDRMKSDPIYQEFAKYVDSFNKPKDQRPVDAPAAGAQQPGAGVVVPGLQKDAAGNMFLNGQPISKADARAHYDSLVTPPDIQAQQRAMIP